MKILLSPAKSIDTSRVEKHFKSTVPTFLNETDFLVGKLKKMKAKKLMELMHISKDLAELNEERYRNYTQPLEQTQDIVPAVLAFTGEVYRGLNAHSFTEKELETCNEKIWILSGLYGILKPMDLMYPYRLEMGTKWMISAKFKNLYQYWVKKLSLFVKNNLNENEVILNLASNEYFKVIDQKTLNHKIITPVFKEFKNGDYKVVMMYAKHARGAMARWIIQNNIEFEDDLKLYNVDGYIFDVNQSTETEWVFTR
jgi:cytoplasmic iron level regulating protein YaaA (DUF328/UPF0246 family)